MNDVYLSEKELIEWMNQWSNRKVTRGKSIKEILSYNGISLWGFYQVPIYSVLKMIPTKKIRSSTNIILIYLMNRFCKSFLIIKTIIRFVLGKLILKEENYLKKNQRKIMIIGSNWIDTADPMLESPKQDLIFGSLIKACKKNYNIIALDQDIVVESMRLLDLRKLFEKAKYNRGIWKTIESFTTFEVLYKVFKYSRKIERMWKELLCDPNFINSLNPNGINIFCILKPTFNHLAKYITVSSILYLELMKKAISIEGPDLIIISDEYDTIGKAATLAGKLNGVPTLAIQHGTIYPLHPGYIHFPSEVSKQVSINHSLIPDKTAVYGSYTKEILNNHCNYPNDAVEITGQPRYDILARVKEIFDKEEFLKRYGLDTDKKIVLLITQNRRVSEKFLRTAVKALKQLIDVQTIIKPHPNENKKWLMEVLKEEDYKAVILNPKANTYEALYACDLMITVYSTVAIEAMCLRKPVIIVNLLGMPDPLPYVDIGAALGVYEEGDVNQAITDALFKTEIKEKLIEGMEKFVNYHLFDIGNATNNIINLINNLLYVQRKSSNGKVSR